MTTVKCDIRVRKMANITQNTTDKELLTTRSLAEHSVVEPNEL